MSIVKKILCALSVSACLSMVQVSSVFADPNEIIFPVIGQNNYSDTFYAFRSGQVDNKHHAIDIFANKHSKIVAPVDGVINYVGYPQDSWGWYMVIEDKHGFEYHFMHINNDTPGTDDGNGGAMNAYAPDMKKGNTVKKGQFIAYLGDSGNAETTPAHLHFEIIYPNYTSKPYRNIPIEGFVNPFTFLNKAPRITSPINYPALESETLPFGSFDPGVNVARGNFDNDVEEEIVVGAGAKGGPHVKIYNKDKTFTGKQFFAYNKGHQSGTDVAAGDIDGDGIDEIITGAGPGGGPHVRVFKRNGSSLGGFFAYNAKFSGGVDVAAGDIDGDGIDEIITGAGPGGGPHVRVFKRNGSSLGGFFAYNAKFSGGVDVAAGDIDGDGIDEIITGAGPGGGPHVRVFYFSKTKSRFVGGSQFFAYASSATGGVRVSVGNVDSQTASDEIVTIPETNGGPNIKVFSGKGNILKSDMAYEEWWYGYNDVAAGDGDASVGLGVNRRASVRTIFSK